MQPNILYEDDTLLIIDKPAGWIVNRADTSANFTTIQDWIEERNKSLGLRIKNLNETSDFAKRSGIVHRIDKDTSGILVGAKTQESFDLIQNQFKERKVKKTYIALTHGKIVNKEGIINAPIGRLPWNRMRFGVFPTGRESKTSYKVIGYRMIQPLKNKRKNTQEQEILTYLEVYPATGRTHQIRVHFLYLGHPMFGDALYAGRKTARLDRQFITRHFLHAARIEFIHPTTKTRVRFESPLPADLSSFLSSTITVIF